MVAMELWDTAGQEKVQSVSESFYANVDACVLVYDTSSHFSFETLTDWYNEFDVKAGLEDIKNFPFIVIGNKTDLGKSNVSTTEIDNWCSKMSSKVKIRHFEASALSNINVKKAFDSLAPLFLSTRGTSAEKVPETTAIGGSSDHSRGGCCIVS